LIIFIAILLHKAPAAIGFGTYLSHEGLSGWNLSKYLLAFTLTCPIASCVGYFALNLLHVATTEEQLMFWVGILLLVSAGSFLYVATIHILPEVFSDEAGGHDHHHF